MHYYPGMQIKTNIKRLTIIILGLGCIVSVALGQSATTSVKAALSNNRILMGDQVKLNVQVAVPVGTPVNQWYNLPDTFNHIEVLNRSKIDSAIEGSIKTYNQTFTITAFDSGIWNIPVLNIVAGNTEASSVATDLTVVPVQLKDSAYHDIRDIIDVPVARTPWWYWVAAVLSAILLGVLIWLWLKSRKGKPIKLVQDKSALSALEEALKQLRDLKLQGLPEKGEWKKYYTSLTTIFKAYNERKYHMGAMQKTTDELLLSLEPKLFRKQLGEVAEALRISDAVKFARYEPEIQQASQSITDIEKALKELDALK